MARKKLVPKLFTHSVSDTVLNYNPFLRETRQNTIPGEENKSYCSSYMIFRTRSSVILHLNLFLKTALKTVSKQR